MATLEDLAAAPATTAFTYCSECGQENPSYRGACIMCFTALRQPGSGLPCPQCGTDNPKDAQFCQNSGTALGGKPKPKTISEAALAVLHGGVAALTTDGEDEDGGFYEEEDESGGFLAGAPVEAPAPAPPPAPVAAPPAPPVYEEEDEDMGLGPKALDVVEETAVPVAAAVEEGVLTPDADELDDLFAAPPPPPPGMDEEEDFAPPPPPPAVDDEEEEAFAPPPPPPALEDEERAVAPAAEAPAAPPAVAPAAGEDDDFGDWSLDMEADQSSSS